MIQPGVLPLSGGRYVPFTYAIDVAGVDLTGATLTAQVRLTPDAPGAPLTTFQTSLSQTTSGGLPTSSLTLFLPEATMTAMPTGAEPGDPVVLAWDLKINPAAGNAYVLVGGSFTIIPGVTHG